ncbi:MAG: hypothetical protein HFI85_04730 [Clostridia bacterium]|jgi:hypothetical protein|nr:hypothetical protein [Clostridia bacterium]
MNFIERLNTQQTIALIKEFKISKREDENKMPYSIRNGELHVWHSTTTTGKKIESIFKEFEIVQIYNGEPSQYDQRRFQNYMIETLEKFDYRKNLMQYLNDKYPERDYH